MKYPTSVCFPRILPCLVSMLSMLSLLSLFQSCELLNVPFAGTERVKILLPSPHPALSLLAPGTIPSYTLRWYDVAGCRHEQAGITSPVILDLSTSMLTPVLLIPETGSNHPGTLPCAGALYPVHAGRKNTEIVLETGWNTGMAASLTEEICLSASEGFETGRNIAAHFNWMRFLEKLSRISDPLALDRKRFREAVLAGKVTIYDITEGEKISVHFSAPNGTIPQDAPFISAWPDQEGFRWPASDELSLMAPEGQTCFYGTNGVIVFQVEKGKQVCVFYSPYSLQD